MNETPTTTQSQAGSAAVAQLVKGKSIFLTLEYVLASLSVVGAVLAIGAAISIAFSLWTSSSTAGLGIFASSLYMSAIGSVVAAVVFSLSAWYFYRRVTQAIAERPGYTGRTAYKATTYTLFALLLIIAVFIKISLLTTIVSSLVLIGTNTDIGALYLTSFLPQLVFGLVVVAALYFVYRILRGRNTSRVLTLTLVAIASVLFIAHIITVAVHSHSDTSSSRDNSLEQFEDLYNSSRNGSRSTW